MGTNVKKDDFNDITADRLFIDKLINGITIGGAIPFQPPLDYLIMTIHESYKKFVRYYDDAVTRCFVAVRNENVESVDSLNKHITLPEFIVAVNRVHTTESPINFDAHNRLKPDLLLHNRGMFGQYINGSMDSGASTSISVNRDRNDHIAAVYELTTLDYMYDEGISVSYNKLKHRLQLLSEYRGQPLVLEVYRSVEISTLYDDDIFFDYTLGKSLLGLAHMLDSFQFNMPGSVEINRTSFESRGERLVEEATRVLKEETDSPIMLMP